MSHLILTFGIQVYWSQQTKVSYECTSLIIDLDLNETITCSKVSKNELIF